MKIQRHYRPEACASKDEDRFNLTDPYLDVEHEKLVATDGYRLVAVPVEIDEDDVSGYVSRELLQVGRRKSDKKVGLVDIRKRIDLQPHGIEWPVVEARKFPAWREVLPPFAEGGPGTITIGLNARLLKGIADALGSEGQLALTVKVDQVNSAPIVVRALRGSREEVGVLMPVRVGEDGEVRPSPVVDLPPTEGELKKAAKERGDDPDEPESMDLPGVPPGTPPNAVLRWAGEGVEGEELLVASVPTGRYELRPQDEGFDAAWVPWSGKEKSLGRGLEEARAKEACQRHNVERLADALVGPEMSKAELKGEATARKKGGRR